MKTKILLTFLFYLSFFNYSHAQHDYVPMAVEDATYLLYTADYDFLPPWEDYNFGYKIKGDIEIDGQWYKKVYYRSFCAVNPPNGPLEPPLYICDEYLIGAIRDNIPNKKVYAYLFEYPFYQLISHECPLNTEILLYDFDMNIGDFFTEQCVVISGDAVELASIEEYFFEDADRFTYYLTMSGFYWGYIYEGIGSDSGLFDPVWSHFEAPATIPLVYCVGEDQDCLIEYLIGVDDAVLNQQIIIYPNPVSEWFFISLPYDFDIQSIQVYDIYGKIVQTKIDNFEKIYIGNLQDGLYLLKVNLTHGIISKKIIKKTPMSLPRG